MNRKAIPKQTKLEQMEDELEDLLHTNYEGLVRQGSSKHISDRIKQARIAFLKKAIPEHKMKMLLEVSNEELE